MESSAMVSVGYKHLSTTWLDLHDRNLPSGHRGTLSSPFLFCFCWNSNPTIVLGLSRQLLGETVTFEYKRCAELAFGQQEAILISLFSSRNKLRRTTSSCWNKKFPYIFGIETWNDARNSASYWFSFYPIHTQWRCLDPEIVGIKHEMLANVLEACCFLSLLLIIGQKKGKIMASFLTECISSRHVLTLSARGMFEISWKVYIRFMLNISHLSTVPKECPKAVVRAK